MDISIRLFVMQAAAVVVQVVDMRKVLQKQEKHGTGGLNMTIDEAIKHCEEVAERQEYLSTQDHGYCEEKWNVKARERCAECAADHRQLAAWLKELKKAKRFIREIENKLYLGTSFYHTSFLKENERLFDELTKGVEHLDD